ncbi:hypothetical protein [Rhizobium sp. 42MFCr.1]|uniref:hypothetical protein n=1 Tax=Rhizobium sp. 42MFCr.1 TaxID=1048680 RepID=UPI0003A4C4B7|nr:hypothetical protein [Rhizobium sp. 42MFCr.1]
MLKSLFKEIIGASPATDDPCPSLLGFRNLSWVLVLFEGAADDRLEMQEELLANQQGALEKQAVTILCVAGGGVFDSLDTAADIGADAMILKDLPPTNSKLFWSIRMASQSFARTSR